MAVISCRMRKDVMCEKGAEARALVYLCKNFGMRRLKRSIRDCDVGGGGCGVAKCRLGGFRKMDGWRVARRMECLNMLVRFMWEVRQR